MIKIGDNYYRNLEEQVQKNKEDIANHYNVDRVLADFGIRIIGTVTTVNGLPDPSTFTGDYGDAYAVGTSAPYVFYIWTRADVDSGHPEDYWLNIGKLAIVGPQGPQGPQGDKGDTGEASRWYYGTGPAASEVIEGDMLLMPNGDVLRYQQTGPLQYSWVQVVNIKGPIGLQGIQGPTGPQGPQGVQGPKGDTGDVGGFINIYGILTNANQLPNPDDLDNRTIAYLIGTEFPYDLYIQVGDADGPVNWVNSGPLNVSTLVTVNGQYQNIWDADTKLDKVTNTYGDNVFRVYCIDNNGNQQIIRTTDNTNVLSSKKYVDGLPSNSKTESGAEYFKIYAKDDLSDQAWKIFTPGSFRVVSSDWGYATDWTPSQMIHSVLQSDGSSLTKIFEFPTNSGTLATTNDVETEIGNALADVKNIQFLRQEIPAGGEVTLLPNSLYMISVSGNNVCLANNYGNDSSSDITGKGQFLIVFCADIGTAGVNQFAVMGLIYGGGLSIDTFTVVAMNGITKLKNYNTSSTAGYNLLVKQ